MDDLETNSSTRVPLSKELVRQLYKTAVPGEVPPFSSLAGLIGALCESHEYLRAQLEAATVAAQELEANNLDWRIGLSAKPKFRQHEAYYESPAIIISIHESGHGGIFCKDGVLLLEGRFGVRFLAPADEWRTC